MPDCRYSFPPLHSHFLNGRPGASKRRKTVEARFNVGQQENTN